MTETRAAAFERVFRADHAALVAFCFRRVNDHELAHDLSAEAFRIAWARWDEPRRSDRAWLFGVARNLIGNEYSRRASDRAAATPVEVTQHGPRDDRSDAAFVAVDVQAVLETLTSTQQEVLRLTYWEGLTASEAAESLGVTAAAVWVRLTRARRAFSIAWQDQSPTSPLPIRSRP